MGGVGEERRSLPPTLTEVERPLRATDQIAAVPARVRAPAWPAPPVLRGGSEGAVETPADYRAPAVPVPLDPRGGSEGAVETPADYRAPAQPAQSGLGGRFGRGAQPPSELTTPAPAAAAAATPGRRAGRHGRSGGPHADEGQPSLDPGALAVRARDRRRRGRHVLLELPATASAVVLVDRHPATGLPAGRSSSRTPRRSLRGCRRSRRGACPRPP